MSTVPLHTRRQGPRGAPPLVLLPSLGTDGTLFDPQLEHWIDRYDVLTCDLRGHGRSPSPHPPYRIEELAADVLVAMDAAGLPGAHVLGISMGGLVAAWLAATHPTRVHRLVLANTAARIGTPQAWRERADLVRWGGMGAVADGVVERFLSPAFVRAEPHTARRLRHGLLGTSDDGYIGCCLALAEADLRPEVTRISAPTLVLTGTEDVATPVRDAQWLADHLPDARLTVFDGAGHLSNLERPEPFTAAVDAFLTED